MQRWQKVGIIAGGGNLPVQLAQACETGGAAFHVIRLAGYADAEMEKFPGDEVGIAEFGKIIRRLKEAACDAVVMVGVVRRPNFSQLRPDWRGAALLPKVVKAARQGDGAMLNVLVDTLGAEGLMVVGAEEVAIPLTAPHGAIGEKEPLADDIDDMKKASRVVAALGPFDVGQGAVVRNGYVLAVEAAEGTDMMLRRCASLPPEQKGFEPGEAAGGRGVLLKRPKPGQERRVDLPTIGVRTVTLAAEAGLAGIAIEAGGALILDQAAVAAAADAADIFVYGFSPTDLKG